ncbi:hypothetical protein [Actinophytocola sp. KF-1]
MIEVMPLAVIATFAIGAGAATFDTVLAISGVTVASLAPDLDHPGSPS